MKQTCRENDDIVWKKKSKVYSTVRRKDIIESVN